MAGVRDYLKIGTRSGTGISCWISSIAGTVPSCFKLYAVRITACIVEIHTVFLRCGGIGDIRRICLIPLVACTVSRFYRYSRAHCYTVAFFNAVYHDTASCAPFKGKPYVRRVYIGGIAERNIPVLTGRYTLYFTGIVLHIKDRHRIISHFATPYSTLSYMEITTVRRSIPAYVHRSDNIAYRQATATVDERLVQVVSLSVTLPFGFDPSAVINIYPCFAIDTGICRGYGKHRKGAFRGGKSPRCDR